MINTLANRFKISKNLLVYIFLSVFMLLTTSCRKTVTTYYASGKVESELSYQGDKLDGPALWYFESGEKKQKATYKNDLLEGMLTRWYVNGDKELEELYQNGKRNGLSKLWDEDRHLIEQKTYRNDTLHGSYKKWFSDGILQVEGNYKQGMYDGIWKYFSEEGIKVGEGNFIDGAGILTGYSLLGKKTREVGYVKNERNGIEKWFDAKGNTVKEVLYKNGRIAESSNDK